MPRRRRQQRREHRGRGAEEERGARAPARPARRCRCPDRSCRRSGAARAPASRRAASTRSGRASRSAARRSRRRASPRARSARCATSGCASSRRSHSGSPAARRRARAGTSWHAERHDRRRWAPRRRRDRLDLRHALRLARAHARVEDEVEQVHDEVRDDHADREHQQQALRERVVAAERRLLQREAGARVAEDELDEDEAADGGRELRGEAVERRQDGVAAGVARSSRGGRARPLAWAIAT